MGDLVVALADELGALDDAQQAQRRAVDLPRAQRPQPDRRAVGLVAFDDIGGRQADHVLGGATQQLQREVVRVDDETLLVERERGCGQRVEHPVDIDSSAL
jgi:hypothetical protein